MKKTSVEIYKKKKRQARIMKWSSPFVFWILFGLAMLFFILCLTNSIGNLIQISDMLDNTEKTGEEIQANYDMLVAKYGTWVIGSADKGFFIEFVNVKRAIINGFSVSFFFLGVFSLLSAYILGKWLFPMLSSEFNQSNQDAVNIEVLKNLDEKEKNK